MKALNWLCKNSWIVRPLLVTWLAMSIISLVELTGVERGMDHRIGDPLSDEQLAISIALSESVYGVHLGYVGLRSVYDKLFQIWSRGTGGYSDPLLLQKNSKDAGLMNEALHGAASLGPQTPGYFTDGSLTTTVYNDMGEIDFYRMAFALFGLKIQSAYYFFFVILTLSVFIFILTFHDDIYALAGLLCTLFAFYIALHLNVYTARDGTFGGMRHGSALGLIPMWYFAFLLMAPRRASLPLFGGALVELAILLLAWRIRGSASWIFIFLFLLALVFAAVRVFATIRLHLARSNEVLPRPGVSRQAARFTPRRIWSAWQQSWPDFLRALLCWPVVLLLLGILGNSVYNQQSRHLIYSTDDEIPYHGLWWSALRGLIDDGLPISSRAKDAEPSPEGWWYLLDYIDRIHLIPWNGIMKMSAKPPPGLISPWTQAPKFRLADEVFEAIYFDAVTRHPLQALRIYLHQRPLEILQVLKSTYNTTSREWIWLTLGAAAIVFGMVLLFNDGKGFAALGKFFLVSAAAVPAATLPNLWAFAAIWAMADAVLVIAAFTCLALGLGAFAAFSYARECWRYGAPTGYF